MRIYMAGGVSGNLKPLWHELANGVRLEAAHARFLGRNREPSMDSAEDGYE